MSLYSTKQENVDQALTEFVAETAVYIQQRGWTNLACFLLETGTPLAFVGGQMIWLAQPMLSLLLPSAQLERTALLLENPAALTALHKRLQTGRQTTVANKDLSKS